MCLFSYNLLCVALFLYFLSHPLCSTLLSSRLFFSTPMVVSRFSPSLCSVSFYSNHFFTNPPMFSLFCLSASLIPLPIYEPLCLISALVPHFFCCLLLSQLECDNFITVIQKVNDTILVCGTNAGSPRCWMLVRVSSDIP